MAQDEKTRRIVDAARELAKAIESAFPIDSGKATCLRPAVPRRKTAPRPKVPLDPFERAKALERVANALASRK